MLRNKSDRKLGRFSRWLHRAFDDWFFRYLLGPAQVDKAVDGTAPAAREQWKHNLEHRKGYTREQRKRERLARETRAAADHSARPSSRSGTP
jgi:mannitol-1-phosphate/altronate dehydrogenase